VTKFKHLGSTLTNQIAFMMKLKSDWTQSEWLLQFSSESFLPICCPKI